MRRTFKILIVTIALLYTAKACTVDSVSGKHLELPISEAELKLRHYMGHPNHKYVTPQNIVIEVNTEGLRWIANSDQQRFDFLTKKLIPAITDHMSQTFKVPERAFTQFNKDSCADLDTSRYKKQYNAHLVLFFTAEAERSDGFVAWASPCTLNQQTLRPNAGRVNFNPYHLKTDKKNFFDQFATTLHEVYHIMGFSPNLYRLFTHGNGKVQGEENVYIKNGQGKFKHQIVSKNVVEFARKHYGNPNIKGVPLEDGGGSGSKGAHWEKVTLGNEVMVANTVANPVVSKFTLSLMQDTGWYEINFNMAEPFFWGMGMKELTTRESKICDYHGHTCKQEGQEGCFYDHTFQATCSAGSFANGCNFMTGTDFDKHDCRIADNKKVNTDIFGEYWGYKSRCFQGKLQGNYRPHSNFCFKTECDQAKSLKIITKQKTLVCSKSYERITNPFGNDRNAYITCPNIYDFCVQLYYSCPKDCHLNGRCLYGKKCYCYPGFSESNNCAGQGESSGGYNGGSTTPSTDQNTKCPYDCNNNGSCNNGTCSCNSGWGGRYCAQKTCPQNCNGNGRCNNGVCSCNSGWTGSYCSQRGCPQNCNGNGRCNNGRCYCNQGYTGNYCGAKKKVCCSFFGLYCYYC